ncbi:hypothetical protein A2V54_00425 [candidate division WWE3 bacterium RBG_19FT_COMBO_53_11]|uniref:Uncharacterized protein n=1 Tax=candidate division WWE3 bacterium RBG_19FT_COMBO_53_11 TaxID=1802613 RepID=A0A1F4UIJ0_UNCKA|nr:MAG: hypothetical protein A2V54_00425 [candidate division WWE3 bacterium RBG_19FT_COMBO_53_11]
MRRTSIQMTYRQRALARDILNRNLVEVGERPARANVAQQIGATTTIREANWLRNLNGHR